MRGSTDWRAAEAGTDQEPRHTLRNSDDEVVHLVCCRDPGWNNGWCGAPANAIDLTPRTVCTLCVEIAEELLPGFLDNDPPRCPMDGAECPDEHDIDLRILREVSP